MTIVAAMTIWYASLVTWLSSFFFENKFDLMRALLVQYIMVPTHETIETNAMKGSGARVVTEPGVVTGKGVIETKTTTDNLDAIIKRPNYHLVKHFPNEAISELFFKTFTFNSFALCNGTYIIPNTQIVTMVSDILIEPYNQMLLATKAAYANFKQVQEKLNTCKKANAWLNYQQSSLVEKAIRCCFYYMHGSGMQKLGADGAPTNAGLTIASLRLVAQVCKKAQSYVFCYQFSHYIYFAQHLLRNLWVLGKRQR